MAALVGVAAAVLLVLIATGVLVSVPRPFANMFGYRSDPWPEGVQEDDAFQWRWTRRASAAPEDPPSVASAGEPGPVATVQRQRVRAGVRSRF